MGALNWILGVWMMSRLGKLQFAVRKSHLVVELYSPRSNKNLQKCPKLIPKSPNS